MGERPNLPPTSEKIRRVLDERQITHLICAHLKYDLYDFFRGVSWACAPKYPPEKDHMLCGHRLDE